VLFTAGALQLVHRYSGGIPRVVNQLCDRALLAGHAAGTRRIDEGLVATAAAELQLEPVLPPPPSWLARMLRRRPT
jgi:general secretion pathway protein A